jgi:hypothetical protein
MVRTRSPTGLCSKVCPLRLEIGVIRYKKPIAVERECEPAFYEANSLSTTRPNNKPPQLLTGGLLVRVQPEEPPSKLLPIKNLQDRPNRSIELPQRKSLNLRISRRDNREQRSRIECSVIDQLLNLCGLPC